MKTQCVSALLVAIVAVACSEPAVAAGEPSRGSGGPQPVFVPFDFYPRHREELGLNNEQVRAMQRLSDEMRDSALSLERERRERTSTLQEAMAQDSIDPERAMELFQDVLKVENELKALQFRNGIIMRNLLTPAQSAKLQPLATKEKGAGAAYSGVLDEKLQQLRAEIRKRSVGGAPSREIVATVEQIEQAARQGHVTEAKAQIDEMLRQLRSGATPPPPAGAASQSVSVKKEEPINARKAESGDSGEVPQEQPTTGLKPLTEMTAEDSYKGEDGGLYGGGKNEPPPGHHQAAAEALKKITPRDAHGQPSAEGKIVFISLGMSNTFGEFRMFKEIADRDPVKSPAVQIVNCAIGGAGVSSWAKPQSGTWQQVDGRLKEAGVTREQVQVAWIKHAEPGPNPDSSVLQYAKQVRTDLASSLAITQSTFPNLRVAYLSSRIYGGYNTAGLRRVNPEPFAYETAFAVRWVIQDQINSEKMGKTPNPVLLWGPYLWADGITPRKTDGLVWERKDLSNDGVHPSPEGGEKVANLLLNFFKTDRGAKTWFAK